MMDMDADRVAGIAKFLAQRLAGIPAWKVLADAEIERGYKIIRVGSVSWLPAADWHENDCVSRDGDDVRLVAIAARHPGMGAFSRLIASITAAGLHPVVICPVPTTVKILRHWGWKGAHVGNSFSTREEQWRPPRKARG